MATQTEYQFRWTNEFAPVVGTAREPAQNEFGADNGQRKSAPGAVQRADNCGASRSHEAAEAFQKSIAIGNVLYRFECQDNVKPFSDIDN